MALSEENKIIALDCEMVDISELRHVEKDALARVSIVNSNYDVIYDEYVMPDEPITNYRTRVSGITPQKLVHAKSFNTAQQEVKEILQGRILVGHSLQNDFKVLKFSHPEHLIRDLSKYYRSLGGRRWPPGLKRLAKLKLGKNIQNGSHCSIEDAKICMEMYNQVKHVWN